MEPRQSRRTSLLFRCASALFLTLAGFVLCPSLAALESKSPLGSGSRSQEDGEEVEWTRQQKWAFMPHSPASTDATESHQRSGDLPRSVGSTPRSITVPVNKESSSIEGIENLEVRVNLPVDKESSSSIRSGYVSSETRPLSVDPCAHAGGQDVVRDDRTLLDVFAESCKEYLTRRLVCCKSIASVEHRSIYLRAESGY